MAAAVASTVAVVTAVAASTVAAAGEAENQYYIQIQIYRREYSSRFRTPSR